MIAIIDHCGANLTSVMNALKRLDCDFVLTTNAKKIMKSSHVILPGVGTAEFAMTSLIKLNLVGVLRTLQQPLLGICLGMQLLYEFSAEGNVECLGLIPGVVEKFPKQPTFPVPHIGWSRLNFSSDNDLLHDIEVGSYVYFVHSYRAPINNFTLATSNYYQDFSALVKNNNFIGMQFHPERSSKIGMKLLWNFVSVS